VDCYAVTENDICSIMWGRSQQDWVLRLFDATVETGYGLAAQGCANDEEEDV